MPRRFAIKPESGGQSAKKVNYFVVRDHQRQLGLELVAAWATSYRDQLGIGKVVNCLETAKPVRLRLALACLVINRQEDLRHQLEVQVQGVWSGCPRKFQATRPGLPCGCPSMPQIGEL